MSYLDSGVPRAPLFGSSSFEEGETGYDWQSATFGGVGGKTGGIYSHDFGSFDPTPTAFYTSGGTGTCVGCHTLSRDGSRMAVMTDDPDGDDEFADVKMHVMDVATQAALGHVLLEPRLRAPSRQQGLRQLLPARRPGLRSAAAFVLAERHVPHVQRRASARQHHSAQRVEKVQGSSPNGGTDGGTGTMCVAANGDCSTATCCADVVCCPGRAR